jgi:hypothetical protein
MTKVLRMTQIGFVVTLALTPQSLHATEAPALKLPFANGRSFVLVQGYNSPPTHIKKDQYAMDFSENKCEAYGEDAVAVSPGTILFVGQTGYNGGYGTEILVKHGTDLVSRYAHLIPGSVNVYEGEWVAQGETMGEIGNSGWVAGMACPEHLGTHLHFAMDRVASNGAYGSYLVEPISGYTNLTAGTWYRSDNALRFADVADILAIVSDLVNRLITSTISSHIFLSASVASSVPFVPLGPVPIVSPLPPLPTSPEMLVPLPLGNGGGVTMTPAAPVNDPEPVAPQPAIVATIEEPIPKATTTEEIAVSSTIDLTPFLSQLDHSTLLTGTLQAISFPATTTMSSLALWTHPTWGETWCCSESYVVVSRDPDMATTLASSSPVIVHRTEDATERLYNFPEPQIFSAGTYWFSFLTGPTVLNWNEIFGTPTGTWYFRILP